MKKNVLFIILVVLLSILSSFLAITLYKERHKPSNVNPGHTDTVYVNKPFNPIPQFKFVNLPYFVTFWNEPEVKIDTVYTDNTSIHYVIPSGHAEFNHQFLLKYPESPKLIQMTTSKGNLDFTFLKPDGLIRTESYTFYPEVNYYNYQNSGLTYKRKPFFQRFEISPEVQVRPLVNMYDLNLGLKYKTRKIYYEIGINSYYYPTFGPQALGFTPYLKVGLTI